MTAPKTVWCDICRQTVVRQPLKDKNGVTFVHSCPVCGATLHNDYTPHVDRKVADRKLGAVVRYHGTNM